MNHTITICDVEGVRKPEVIEYTGSFADWLFTNYDQFDVPTRIYAGGLSECFLIAEFNENSDPTKDEFLRLNLPHDKIFIVQSPLGAGVTAFLWAVAQNIAIAAAVAIVTNVLMGKPELSEGTRESQGSPNNNVGPQTNTARAFDRVPDVYGEDRCTPDLTTTGSFEFLNHIKFITQDMCISHGFGLIEDVKSGETPFSTVIGSTLDIFEPGQTPVIVIKDRESNDVKSLTLNPPNESGTSLTIDDVAYYSSIPDIGYIASGLDIFQDLAISSTVILSEVFFGANLSLEGEYVIVSKTDADLNLDGLLYDYAEVSDQLTIHGDFSTFAGTHSVRVILTEPALSFVGWMEIISKSNTSMRLRGDLSPTDESGTFSVDDSLSVHDMGLDQAVTINGNWTQTPPSSAILEVGNVVYNPRVQGPDEIGPRGPFVVPGNDNGEVWLDIQFPRGLVRDNDKSVSVDVKWVFEELDSSDVPTGVTFDVNENFTDDEVDPRFYTIKVTSADGLVPGNNYRVTAERTSDTNLNDVTLQDQCQWTRMSGIENITKPDNTGTTRIQVFTQATEQTAALQQSQINLKWTRKCLTYDGLNVIGNLDTGVGLTVSRKMADNFLTYSFDPLNAARNQQNLDLDAIYAIQSELDLVFSGEKGEFSFTFANKDEAVINEMRQIANSCRCFLTHDGSVISMVRDQKQDFPQQLFNRRNKIPFADRKSYVTSLPLDYDGIELEYKDRADDDEVKTIKLPEDLPPSDPNFGNPPAKKHLQVQAVGMRNRSQAWDRAQYEYNRLLYKRRSVQTTVTNEGLFLELNSRVEVTDNTRPSNGSDGEVLGINVLDVDSSELFIPESSKTYSAIFRNEDGTVSNAIPVVARADTQFGFTLSSSIELYLRGKDSYQLGSLYNIAPDDAQGGAYLVQSITPSDVGEVALELINYDERYYQADDQIAPV